MSIRKSVLGRTLSIASMTGGMLKQEAKRLIGNVQPHLVRLEQARILVEELGRLKGAAMKLGQILALEARDFLPPEVVAILEKLQNQSTFMDADEVRKILGRELGPLFGTDSAKLKALSEKPIAAASIGQVHRAEFEGAPVAVKIQYPGIQDTIDSDLKIFRSLVERLTPLLVGHKTDYSGLFEEMREVFINETSYLFEAEMTEKVRGLVHDLPNVRVPRVYTEVSTDFVLVTSFESGMTLSEALRSGRLTPELRIHYADLFLRVYMMELCEWGLVQTDPNLGNFLLDLESRELVLLDFGAVRTYSPEFRNQYSRLIIAAVERRKADCLAMAAALGVLDSRESESTKDTFYHLIDESIEPFRAESFDFSKSHYAEKLRDKGAEFIKSVRFTPPPKDLVFLHRKLGGIFQILRRLEVSLDLRPYLQPHRRAAAEQPAKEIR
ncbi:MAG: AarF/ABC1/UbiB kinase family protein [Cryobacterium sp.]|nr:AarF/ABC1/UbiB kinase family protein [Oligoflexia bacterium]